MALTLVERKDLGYGEGFVLSTPDRHLVLSSSSAYYDSAEQKRKWKIGISLTSGCTVGCLFCFTRNLSAFRQLSVDELVEQVDLVHELSPLARGVYDEVKVEMKEMGDPAVNHQNSCDAIRRIQSAYADLLYVVSTSGVKNPAFYAALKAVRAKGAPIRLQFSCHTTSDEQRKILYPCLPMMSLEDIAKTVRDWYSGEKVTLTFVPFKGYELSSEKLEIFDPRSVFVKISYVDRTDVTEREGFLDEDEPVVNAFVNELREKGYAVGYRHRV